MPSCAYAEFWLPWVSTSITRCLGEELGRKDTCCQHLDYIVLMLLVWVDGLVDPHLWHLNWSTWQKLVAVKCVTFLKFFLILLLNNWRFPWGGGQTSDYLTEFISFCSWEQYDIRTKMFFCWYKSKFCVLNPTSIYTNLIFQYEILSPLIARLNLAIHCPKRNLSIWYTIWFLNWICGIFQVLRWKILLLFIYF